MMRIPTSGTTCPKCESCALGRRFRNLWMHKIQISKYYSCLDCGHEFFILFDYKLYHKLPLYSLIAILSIVSAIVLLWVIVLIVKEIRYKDVMDFLQSGPPEIAMSVWDFWER
jgi:hypothetical protein